MKSLLASRSGFLALAGEPCRMKDIMERKDERARFARDILMYQVLKNIGSALSNLGGVEAILFVAEPSPAIKCFLLELVGKMSFLGISVSPGCRLSASSSLTGKGALVRAHFFSYDPWQVMCDALKWQES